MGGLADLVLEEGGKNLHSSKINNYIYGHTLRKEWKGWSVFCRVEEWVGHGFFFFKAIKGESQFNVLEIGNYICIASDDINIKPLLLFLFIFYC